MVRSILRTTSSSTTERPVTVASFSVALAQTSFHLCGTNWFPVPIPSLLDSSVVSTRAMARYQPRTTSTETRITSFFARRVIWNCDPNSLQLFDGYARDKSSSISMVSSTRTLIRTHSNSWAVVSIEIGTAFTMKPKGSRTLSS